MRLEIQRKSKVIVSFTREQHIDAALSKNADNQAWRNIRIVDSAGNVFEPVGDFTVKVANADVGDS